MTKRYGWKRFFVYTLFLSLFFLGVCAERPCFSADGDEYGFRHITAAAEKDRFCGWPANGGAWAWGDEIVVLFKQGQMKLEIRGHLIDPAIPQINVQARSLDGGETWMLERNLNLAIDGTLPIKELTEPIDFSHKDFAFVFLKTSTGRGKSYFFYSYDRCKTWDGPYELPLFDEAFVSARTCTLIEGPHEMLAFVSGAPKAGSEFRSHVFLVRTKDGGMNWEKVADVGPLSDRSKWYIMPSAVRVSDKEIICGLRYCDLSGGTQEFGIEIWGSTDNGQTWESHHRLVSGSNPPTLEYCEDGRLLLFYGNRIAPPLGVHARISRDKGKTWSEPIIVRGDAGSFDLGYPKNVFRADGKGILFYYYTLLDPNADRTIEATIWDPEKLKCESESNPKAVDSAESARQIAIQKFDEVCGLDAHLKYKITVGETSGGWFVIFDGNNPRIGDHAMVTINKATGEVGFVPEM